MATGAQVPIGFLGVRGQDLAAIRDRATPVKNRTGLSAVYGDRGGSADALPTNPMPRPSRGGVMAHSFADDYYNRVYFLPATVDFGALSADAAKPVRVWNAHLSSVTLTGVSLVDAAGVTLDGPATPKVFKALELVDYLIRVSPSGPPTLAGSITFTFTPAESFSLRVNGTRAKVAPFTPNWRRGYTIEYQYKTDIFTSRSGREQRRAIRSTPRKQIAFEANPRFDSLQAFNALMASWHDNAIILPEITRTVLTTAPAAIGSTSVPVAAIPDWAVAGATVLMVGDGKIETRQVASAAAGVISFSSASNQEWGTGTKIHPGVSGRLAATLRSRRETNAVSSVSVEFDVTPASEPDIPVPAPDVVFNGRELFLFRPNWAETPDVTYQSARELIDFERGRTAIFRPVDFSTRTVRYTFVGRNAAQMEDLLNHFKRMRGQRGEFYLPSVENDIPVTRVSPVGTNIIRITGTDFATSYEDSTVYKALIVRYRDGTYQCNVIEDIYRVDDSDGEDSVIQVADDWQQIVSPDNVKMVSWLFACRHATDTLTVEWMTDTVGQCQFTMQTIEDLPV